MAVMATNFKLSLIHESYFVYVFYESYPHNPHVHMMATREPVNVRTGEFADFKYKQIQKKDFTD